MIVIDIANFYAYTMPWLKQFNNAYDSAHYQLGSGDYGDAIDDQVLAEILGLTEVA